MNYYEILEVREDASPEVINMAYKGLARKYHPDTYNGDLLETNEIMQKINEAYSILSKPDLRIEYDKILKANKDKKESNMNNKYNNGLIKDQPMKFFSFYINFLFPLEVLMACFSLYDNYKSKEFLDAFEMYLPFYYSKFMLFCIILDFIMVALIIFLFISLRKFTHMSFNCNRMFLILLPATLALTRLAPTLNEWKHYFVAAIGVLIIYIIPSLLYFEKRKFLFDEFYVADDMGDYFANNDNKIIKKRLIKEVVAYTFISILLIVGATLISYLWTSQLYKTI